MNQLDYHQKFELPFLQKIDIFGVGVNIKFDKREKYQTKLGGLFSVVVFILMLVYSLNLLNIILRKTDPIVIFEQNSVSQPQRFDLDSQNFSIAFALLNENLDPFIDDTLYSMSGQIYYRNKIWNNQTQKYQEDVGTQEFQMIPCTEQSFQEPNSRNYFLNLNYTNMYCIKDSSQLFIEGQFDADRFTMLKINITECSDLQNQTIKCQQQLERKKYLENTKLQIYYVNRIIQIRDYSNPFQSVGQTQFWRTNYEMVQQINLMFVNTYIADDTNLFYGESYVHQRDLVFSQDRLLQASRDQDSNQNIYEIEIYMDKNKENVYRRIYQKLPQAISQIGGIFNVFFAIGCLFSHPYAKMQLEKKLINQIFQIKNDDDVNNFKKRSKPKQEFSRFNQNKKYPKNQDQLKNNQNQKKMNNLHLDTINFNLTENQQKLSKQENQRAQKFNQVQEGSQNTFGNEGQNEKSFEQQQQQLPKQNNINPNKSNDFIDQFKEYQLQTKNNDQIKYQNTQNQYADQIKKIFSQLKSLDFFKQLFSEAKLKTLDYINSYIDYFSCQKSSRMLFLENSINKINQHTDICYIINKQIELENLKSLLLDDNQKTLFKCIPKPKINKDQINFSQDKSLDLSFQVNNLYDFVQNQKKIKQTRFQFELMKFLSQAQSALKKIRNNKTKFNIKLLQMLDQDLIDSLNEDLYFGNQQVKQIFQNQNDADQSTTKLEQNDAESQQIQNKDLSQIQTLSIPITQSQYFIQKSSEQINLSFNDENNAIQQIKNIDNITIIPHQLNISNLN
ncbi:hypothetical protein ABPG74_021632 [Tetrahymena malaccensis]